MFALRLTFQRSPRSDPNRTASCPLRDSFMNYPLLPADAAAYAWQLSCCLVTLLFAMFSWLVGPR
ncbi:MAG: hypothetical protein CMM07_22900 [Rhodopirellula sp.]|nr:hypothetical protein [Rhodopirellula sp.]